ncbi:DNA cytosine methyltransferase [Mesorhizobium abyssinicae]|uniref:DNA cytosine methyltransferase n=1 Tax=Mesorhizobium abyssinicae TaxID=1209958 RepID=UPI002A24DD8A|nr:DNA cytosine methyltransferase [Mesorhizobium abyssinicae]MDX8437180.1 DNA cytosine methyltransferase [Mesorhizobium abyssinicae]
MKKLPNIKAVDLFCGAGGLTHGLVRGGIKVVAGVDLDPQCRYPFEANNDATFFEEDVGTLTADRLRKLYGRDGLRLLAGCAPCQPFSTYSRSGRNPRYEQEWPLVSSFGRLVEDLKPDLVTMENVPQLADHSVFLEFLSSLSDYRVWWDVVDCAKFGVPQTRQRLVLMGSKLGARAPSLGEGSHVAKSVRETIAQLPPLPAGGIDPEDNLHISSKLSPINLKRIRASMPGGTWRDWDEELLAACHRKATGATYPSVYGRMEWDKPSPTITTQCFGFGNGRFGHPEQDRAISLREAAMLQTFPRDYEFVPKGGRVVFDKLGRLIGNAVPVRIGEVIADALVNHVMDTWREAA